MSILITQNQGKNRVKSKSGFLEVPVRNHDKISITYKGIFAR